MFNVHALISASLLEGISIGVCGAVLVGWAVGSLLDRLEEPTGLLLRLPFGVTVYCIKAHEQNPERFSDCELEAIGLRKNRYTRFAGGERAA